MTFDQLQSFQTVAAAKSFRRAAELLHLTQPAVSKQIQALETELDQRLFERGRSAELTLAGTALLKHVDRLSRILTVAKEEIADLRELRGGHLSIGAAHSIATYELPRLIEAYRTRYPKINLSIESGWSVEISRRVVSYELDLGLLAIVTPQLEGFPQLTFVPLAATEMVFVVSANDPLSKRKRLTWDDLEEAPWILNQRGCVYRSYIEGRLKECGHTLKVEVEVLGLELQKKLTQLGLGISFLPKYFVKAELQRGSLKALHVAGLQLQAHSCLVFRNDKYLHGAMKAFLKLLEESFKPARKHLHHTLT
jgi:LysR family transcriptional regulator, transcriptional activator of the cysJI operon